jgi:outer membrane protein OmpA-like peptidoglycan-associated protein
VPTGGCDTGGSLPLWLAAVALLFARRRPWWLLLLGGTAAAQDTVPDSGVSLNIQRFEPSGMNSGFAAVHSARMLPKGRVGVEVTANWAFQPLQRSTVIGTTVIADDDAISHLTALHLRAAVGATPWFQISASAPVVQFATSDVGLESFGGNRDRSVGFGDVTLDLAFRPLAESRGVGIQIAPFVTAPSGTRDIFLTHGTPAFGARFALSGTAGPVHLAAHTAYRVRVGGAQFGRDPNDVTRPGTLAVDDHLLYGGGMGLQIVPELRFNVEAVGSTVVGPERARILTSSATPALHSGVEVGGNFLIASEDGFSVLLGGTAGLTPAPGTPTARAFVSIGYAPRTLADRDKDGIPNAADACPEDPEDLDRFEDDDGCPEPDNDGDGIDDRDDDCPDDPEDVDGFQDADGCPERDNDRDRIPDTSDQCPNDPEDKDRWEDKDGCPDPDNDGDTLLDAVDGCPNAAEDFDGFHDDDGCPEEELDRDGDGIIDAYDPCPDVAEDFDSWQDDDGCPELDNDEDGKDDEIDLCPNEPEEYNGYLDEDGCPDETKAVLQEDRIVILEKVLFFVNEARIRPESFGLLDAVQGTLAANPQVTRIRIEGHTDADGSDDYNQDLSERRALGVRQYLIDAGIAPRRLIARGYGELYPIASNRTTEGKEQNRRVEFIVVDEDDPDYNAEPQP